MKNVLKNYSLHSLVAIILIVLFILLSFLPILPVWSYVETDERFKVIYILKYHAYYEGLTIFAKPKDFLSYLFTISFFGSYIFLGLSLVFAIINKKYMHIITLFIDSCLFFIVSFSNNKASNFAAIAFVATLFLVILNLLCELQIRKNSVRSEVDVDEHSLKIGEMIKEKRKELHLTQQELSNRTNISRSLIAKFETGNAQPSDRQLKAFSNALDLDFSTIDKESKE